MNNGNLVNAARAASDAPDTNIGTVPSAIASQSPRRRDSIGYLFLIVLADIGFLIVGFMASSFLRFGVFDHVMVREILPLLTVLFVVTAALTGAYSFSAMQRRRNFVMAGVRALVIALLLLLAALFLLKIGIEFSRILIFSLFVTASCCVGIGRFSISYMVPRLTAMGVTRTLEIQDSGGIFEAPVSQKDTRLFASELLLSADITDHVNVSRLVTASKGYDRVVIACDSASRSAWADLLRCLDVQAEIRLPELDRLKPIALTHDGGRVAAIVMDHPLEWHQALVKRIVDLCITLSLMPILLPLMAIVAIAIRIESPGPIFFMQDRIGLGNRPFRMAKFRSMRHDMSDYKAVNSTERDDPRITRVGRFIRKSSIDELPQFFNVLTGDMSIVGPRPHAYFSKAGGRLFWEVDHKYWHRHIAKPGITGLAQVRGFRGNTFEERDLQDRLDADLEYVANWTLLRDFEILLATVRVLRHDKAF
jgi:polysaccharide biosynthesis protein PslA